MFFEECMGFISDPEVDAAETLVLADNSFPQQKKNEFLDGFLGGLRLGKANKDGFVL